MHPTLALPTTGKLTATTEQVARMRAHLLVRARHTYESRHSYAEGYLTGVIQELANGTPNDLVAVTITQALAVIAAVEQLDAEADGFATTGREDPETGQALPQGVDGFSLGRYAR